MSIYKYTITSLCDLLYPSAVGIKKCSKAEKNGTA